MSLVILVGFTVGHKLGVSGFRGDFLILDLLRHGHGLDVAVGHGIEHHVILIKGGVGLKLTTVAGQAGDLDVGLLVLFHAVSVDHLGNLTHIGVDNHEGHVVIAVHKSLDQNAVAAGLQLGVVALLHGEVGGGLTVHNHVGLGGLAQAQVGVDGLGLDFLGVGGIGGGSIGADLLGAVLPLLGGTAEVIAAIIVHRQIGEILLAELLHLVTVGGNGAVVVGLAVGDLHRGGGAHNNLSAVGSVDGGALVGVVHHVGGQGLERHLGGLLTGHGVGQHDALGGDARVHRVGGHVDGPVVAHIVGNLRVIAQGHQHHLRKGQAGQLALGVEVAVAGARQDALLHAVADVARGPAVGGHVLEGGRVGGQLAGVLLAQQHDSHDLGRLLTGQDAGGVEGALVGALEHTDGGHHINRLSVGDFSRVVEITAHSAGGDDHHAHNQGHGHYQAESPLEVSHLDFLLLNFEA